jgi:esterase/lipase
MEDDREIDLNPRTYEWAVRSFNLVKRLLGVNLKLHQSSDQVAAGDIFLFNHFARFETFIPQYFIYKEAGVFCRSVAMHQLFREGDAFSNFLIRIGAVPNNYPRLLPLLAADILRGRKVIIFPEGGMIKNRQVVDARGRYSVQHRGEQQRRKAHTGAAVLATLLAAFKRAIYLRLQAEDHAQLERWAEQLQLPDPDALINAAGRPTTIVPANITFHPIHVDDNLLQKGASLFNKNLSQRATEELIIEGNIILKDTDMDIRLGKPVRPADDWGWWERWVVTNLIRELDSLDDLFNQQRRGKGFRGGLCAYGLKRSVGRLRDRYMERMYKSVTVNLSHLAATLIMVLMERGDEAIPLPTFQRMLYLAIKSIQEQQHVHLHRRLKDPDHYRSTLEGCNAGLDQFLNVAAKMGLIARDGEMLRFLPKLRHEHEIDRIRLENHIALYANEAAPLSGVRAAVRKAVAGEAKLNSQRLAELRFDDELLSLSWDRTRYSRPQHKDINAKETATESRKPYFLVPKQRSDLGVVLVHGFLASPAELRRLGDRLAGRGHPVIGVRLKGHGTSPWDLRDRCWEDWLESVRQGVRIMRGVADRVCLVGFSTGAALSLLYAAENADSVAAVAAASTPVKFRNRNMIFVPLVQHATRFLRKVSPYDAVFPFRHNEPENPHINYGNIPIRGLYELGRMVDALMQRSSKVSCPVYLLQGSADPVVDVRSVDILFERLTGTAVKSLDIVESQHHGILHKNIGKAQDLVLAFIESIDRTGTLPSQTMARSEDPITQPPVASN